MQKESSLANADYDTTSVDEKQTLIDREIRIQQSVEIQKFLPAMIIGNIFLIIIMFSIDPGLVIKSGAFVAFFMTAAMLIQMLRSHLRLRHRERPENVSQRRIRAINIASILNGLAWVVFCLLALRQADQVIAVMIVLGTTSYGLASLVAMASSPRAALFHFTSRDVCKWYRCCRFRTPARLVWSPLYQFNHHHSDILCVCELG